MHKYFRAVPALTDGEELTASGTHSSKGNPQIKFPFTFQDPVSGDSNPTHLSKLNWRFTVERCKFNEDYPVEINIVDKWVCSPEEISFLNQQLYLLTCTDSKDLLDAKAKIQNQSSKSTGSMEWVSVFLQSCQHLQTSVGLWAGSDHPSIHPSIEESLLSPAFHVLFRTWWRKTYLNPNARGAKHFVKENKMWWWDCHTHEAFVAHVFCTSRNMMNCWCF
jgi:hypothetical protein